MRISDIFVGVLYALVCLVAGVLILTYRDAWADPGINFLVPDAGQTELDHVK